MGVGGKSRALKRRKAAVKKKFEELCTLCGTTGGFILYPNGGREPEEIFSPDVLHRLMEAHFSQQSDPRARPRWPTDTNSKMVFEDRLAKLEAQRAGIKRRGGGFAVTTPFNLSFPQVRELKASMDVRIEGATNLMEAMRSSPAAPPVTENWPGDFEPPVPSWFEVAPVAQPEAAPSLVSNVPSLRNFEDNSLWDENWLCDFEPLEPSLFEFEPVVQPGVAPSLPSKVPSLRNSEDNSLWDENWLDPFEPPALPSWIEVAPIAQPAVAPSLPSKVPSLSNFDDSSFWNGTFDELDGYFGQ